PLDQLDDIGPRDIVKATVAPLRQDMQPKVSIVCIGGPLVPPRVLIEVSIGERLESPADRGLPFAPLLLYRIFARGDLAPHGFRALACFSERDGRTFADGC